MDAQIFLTDIKAKFPDVLEISGADAEKIKDKTLNLVVPAASVYELVKYLKETGFDYLMNLCATDYKINIEVIYHLYSYTTKGKVTLKVKLDREKPEVASVTPLHLGADWQEREAYDMLGVIFTGHPDFRKILLPADWEGYPLRKDYERKPDQYD
ncbi:MAG: NADH-quinone oxidoreductase subunit C, partial [Candidatus Firestonebacteria bacterium]|nr:NADH-quinone oxidoreductase subunit C [Candidatus Firestonebacteria bacterium]